MEKEQKANAMSRIELKDSLLLNKLCDMTGTDDGAYKGFMLFYIDSSGYPQTLMRTENPATYLVLEKLVYNFVEAQENAKENNNRL